MHAENVRKSFSAKDYAHEQAIQARTRLQLDRATEQQAQELENFRLDCQLARSGKRRTEQTEEVAHDLEMTRRRQEAQIRQREALLACAREHRRLEAEFQLETEQRKNAQQQAHLAVLRDLSVDLTAFLTQSRADCVIELRGAAASHFHVDDLTTPNKRSLDNSASKSE